MCSYFQIVLLLLLLLQALCLVDLEAMHILNCNDQGLSIPTPSFKYSFSGSFNITGILVDIPDQQTVTCSMPTDLAANRIAKVRWDQSSCDLEQWAAECQRVHCLAIIYQPTSGRFFDGATACCWHPIAGHTNMDMTPMVELDSDGAALVNNLLQTCPDLQVQIVNNDENVSSLWLNWLLIPWCLVSVHGILNAIWATGKLLLWNCAKTTTTPKAITAAVYLIAFTSWIAIIPGLAYASGGRLISVGISLLLFRLSLDLLFSSTVAISITFGHIVQSLGMDNTAKRRQRYYQNTLIGSALVLTIYDIITGIGSFFSPRWTPKNSTSAAVLIEMCMLLPICVFFLVKGRKLCREILEPKIVTFLAMDERQRRVRFVNRTMSISVFLIMMMTCIASFAVVHQAGQQWILLVASWEMFMLSESALLRAIQVPVNATTAPKVATAAGIEFVKKKMKSFTSSISSAGEAHTSAKGPTIVQ